MRERSRAVRVRLTFLLALCTSCGDDALEEPDTAPISRGPIDLPVEQTLGGPARLLEKGDAARFSGVAQIDYGMCSAAFVVPAGVDLSVDGPAYVLTAGHCIARNVNEILRSPSSSSGLHARFRGFSDAPKDVTKVALKQVVFATMKGVDLALVELSASRQALHRLGVTPLMLSASPLVLNEPIAVVGRPGGRPTSLSACTFRRRVPWLREAGWLWFDAEANDCMDVAPGSSGSPVLSLGTGEVVAVENTRAEGTQASQACGLNSPCEADGAVMDFRPRTNYAIPVSGLNGCFDGAGRFVVDLAGCPLDRDVQMLPSLSHGTLQLKATPGQAVAIEVPLKSRNLTHYRFFVGPAATTDCRDTSRYGAVVSWADAATLRATLPGDAGHHLVCIQAGLGPDPAVGWQDSATPTIVTVTLSAPFSR